MEWLNPKDPRNQATERALEYIHRHVKVGMQAGCGSSQNSGLSAFSLTSPQKTIFLVYDSFFSCCPYPEERVLDNLEHFLCTQNRLEYQNIDVPIK